MTTTLIATAIVMGGAMALMALGVMLGRPALKGSCGGSNADCVCSAYDRLKCRTRKLAGAHEH